MPVWIRALCTKPLGDVDPAALGAEIAVRLPALVELYGEPDPGASVARVARGEAPGALVLAYGAGGSIPVTRKTKPKEVRSEVEALVAALDDSDEEGVDDVRELCDGVVEIAALRLDTADCEGLGWPVAIAAAAALAARGEGLVQSEAEGWMEPTERGVEQVLDGD